MKKIVLIIVLAAGIAIGVFADRTWQRRTEPAKESAPETGPVAGEAGEKTGAATVRAPARGFKPEFVKSEMVTTGEVPDIIPVTGKIAFNDEFLHLVSARVDGRLDKILVFEGARVKAGQALALLYSPDYVSTENEYLLILNTARELERSGNAELLGDARDTLGSVVNKLKVLGASQQDIDELGKKGKASLHLIIRAPISGVVIKRELSPGAFLETGDDFMTIADTSKLWFYGNIYEQDYSRIKIGQELELKSDALPGKIFSGKLSYIAPGIEPETHILPIRCDIPNPTGELRPEIFVNADLVVGQKQAVIVPKSAVIWNRDNAYVIVDRDGRIYERVPVVVKDIGGELSAVTSGLKGGERVVVQGATLVDKMISGN